MPTYLTCVGGWIMVVKVLEKMDMRVLKFLLLFLSILNFYPTSLKDLLQNSCFLTYLLTIHAARYFSEPFEISSIY
jgi:hypothetical protein